MDHSVLTILDLGIIAAYLVIMVLVGVYSVRRIQNTKDYYVAGRSFGPMVLMATVCATIIGGSGLMGRAGVAYTDGFKAVLTAIPYLLGMFIFSGIAGKISDIGMPPFADQWHYCSISAHVFGGDAYQFGCHLFGPDRHDRLDPFLVG